MSLEFDAATHTYTANGKVVPSVTQIISELLPMQFKCDDWYLQRGSAVHACAAMIARGANFDFDERISGQVAAIKKFLEKCIQRYLILKRWCFQEPIGSPVL